MNPKASDAAIERACVDGNAAASMPNAWKPEAYGSVSIFTAHANLIQHMSDALLAVHGDNVPAELAGFVLPVVVDPIVQMVRDILAKDEETAGFLNNAAEVRRGEYDQRPHFRAALSVARAIAAQGGEA